ncbi:MAG: acetoacetyl-CoA reductase [Magnetococcales bacterium]|nr:acetoacetyl-CoA reductase [Magnetococcales bacterium]
MSNRVAVVTGGVGGIGTEICRYLAKGGYKVAATCIAAELDGIDEWKAQFSKDGIEVEVFQLEITDFDDCVKVTSQIEEKMGPISCLVNNAGITKDGTMKKMDKNMWDAVININLTGAFNMTKQVFTKMTEQKFGRIINISSLNGRKGQFGQANYSAAKAGIHGFTMAIAQEGARKGVTVNTVSPGYINTNMMKAIPEDILNKIIAQIPVGRLGEAEEIAQLVAYIASDAAAFMTGANVDMNGGQFIH